MWLNDMDRLLNSVRTIEQTAARLVVNSARSEQDNAQYNLLLLGYFSLDDSNCHYDNKPVFDESYQYTSSEYDQSITRYSRGGR